MIQIISHRKVPTTLPWNRETWSGHNCTLRRDSEDDGSLISIEFEHSDILHAPQVAITPANGGNDKEFNVSLYYYNIAVDLRKAGAVKQATDDIVAFFDECEKEGLLTLALD